MAKYIELEAAIQAAQEPTIYDLTDVPEWLSSLPTADVAPVVRCKDCKWYNNRMCYHPHFEYVCEIPPTMLDFDYCRYGERKDGDG